MKIQGMVITTIVEHVVVDIAEDKWSYEDDSSLTYFQAAAMITPKNKITEHTQYFPIGEV